MNEFVIRKALPKDVPFIEALENDYGFEVYSKDTIISMLDDEHTITNVLVTNDECVGYVSTNYIFEEASILKIIVLSSKRRNGFGKALLKHTINSLIQEKVTKVYLEVRSDNMPAKRLYESVGFKKIHQRQKYYSDGMDADIYYLCL